MKAHARVAAARLRRRCPKLPSLAMVLGSGFGGVVDAVEIEARIPYHQLPGMPQPGVRGHSGQVVVGRLEGALVMVFQGRVHYYEGLSFEEVTFPIRVLAELGVQSVLLTNAAGGINPRYRPGDLMVITDHINFMGGNPLRGYRGETKTRFVDLTRTYDAELSEQLLTAARRMKLRLRQGVYIAVSGPTYETPAECRAFGKWGADAVGMSTVPEAIVARQHGLRVAGLSCITNLAACHTKQPLSHVEVLAMAERVKTQAARLLGNFAQLYAKSAEKD